MKRSFWSKLAKRKWIIITVCVILLVVWGVKRAKSKPKTAETQQATTKVAKGSVTGTVSCSGTVNAEREVDIKSQASGEITSLLVREGDRVKAGDLICIIDPTDMQNKMRTARAQLDSSKAQVEFAQATEKQSRMSVPAEIQADIEAVKSARASLRQAEENYSLQKDTTNNEIASAEWDRQSYNSKLKQSGITKTMTEATAKAAVAQAEQELSSSKAKVAAAEQNLDLAQKTYLNDLKSAQAAKVKAQAALQSSQLTAQTSPGSTRASLASAQETLAEAQEKYHKLVDVTQATDRTDAQGTLNSAETAYKQASAETKRQQELYKKGFVAYSALESAQVTEAAALRTLNNAKEAIRVLEAQQASDRAQYLAQVNSAKADLERAKQTDTASGTTAYDLKQAEATLESADYDVQLAEAKERNVDMRRKELEEAKYAEASAEAALMSASASLAKAATAASDEEQAKYALRKMEVAKNTALANKRNVNIKKSAVDSARADLSKAQAVLTQALADRYSIIKNSAAVRSANSDVVRYQASLSDSEKSLRDTIVKAPRDGVVESRNVEEGTVISSAKSSVTAGTTIVTIADVHSLYVTGLVDESDIGKVVVGQKADFTVEAFGERKFGASVRKIYPKGVTTNNVTQFTVELTIDKTDALLRPQMTADLEIVYANKDNVLVLPAEAVRESTGSYYVLTPPKDAAATAEKAAKAKAANAETPPDGKKQTVENGDHVPIEVGIVTSENVEVLKGLKEGDEVLVPGGAKSSSSASSDSKGKDMGKTIGMGMRSIGGK